VSGGGWEKENRENKKRYYETTSRSTSCNSDFILIRRVLILVRSGGLPTNFKLQVRSLT
jgi:hypothetical protein